MHRSMASAIALSFAAGAAPSAFAASRHALAHILHGPTGQQMTVDRYAGHFNAAGAFAQLTVNGATGWSWAVSSSRQQSHQTSLPQGFYSNGHAGHHNQAFFVGDGAEVGTDGEAPPLPPIGSVGSLASVEHSWRASVTPGLVTYELTPAFVQLDMESLQAGQSMRGGWETDVEGQLGRVLFVGSMLADRTMTFEVILDGIYEGMEFAVTSPTAFRRTLQVDGMQFDVMADLEEFTVHLDSFIVPTPGAVALATVFGVCHARRRRR